MNDNGPPSLASIPVHAIKGLHPAVEPIALTLANAAIENAHARVQVTRKGGTEDLAPILALVTPTQGGYFLIAPVDWMPFVRQAAYHKLPALVMGEVEAKRAAQIAAELWLMHQFHQLHHGNHRTNAAATYLRVLEIANGKAPRIGEVAEALEISRETVKRAKRKLRAKKG